MVSYFLLLIQNIVQYLRHLCTRGAARRVESAAGGRDGAALYPYGARPGICAIAFLVGGPAGSCDGTSTYGYALISVYTVAARCLSQFHPTLWSG